MPVPALDPPPHLPCPHAVPLTLTESGHSSRPLWQTAALPDGFSLVKLFGGQLTNSWLGGGPLGTFDRPRGVLPSVLWIQGRTKVSHPSPPVLSHRLRHPLKGPLPHHVLAEGSVLSQLVWFPPAQEMRDQEWNLGFPLTSPQRTASGWTR